MDVHANVKEACQNTPSLQDLLVSLRTAVVSDEWKLDKQQNSYDDVLDSFRLALRNYELPKNSTL